MKNNLKDWRKDIVFTFDFDDINTEEPIVNPVFIEEEGMLIEIWKDFLNELNKNNK